MSIETTSWFNKQLKQLAKKYRSIPEDYANLLHSLVENPLQGTPIRRGAFKIRMPIASKNSGKSGGSRVITYYRDEKDTLYYLIFTTSPKRVIFHRKIWITLLMKSTRYKFAQKLYFQGENTAFLMSLP